MQIRQMKQGWGRVLGSRDLVELHYTLALAEAALADDTAAQVENSLRMGRPVWVVLGERQLLEALDRSLLGQKVGATIRGVLEPHESFGDAGLAGRIPPNARVFFEIFVSRALPSQCEDSDSELFAINGVKSSTTCDAIDGRRSLAVRLKQNESLNSEIGAHIKALRGMVNGELTMRRGLDGSTRRQTAVKQMTEYLTSVLRELNATEDVVQQAYESANVSVLLDTARGLRRLDAAIARKLG